MTGRTPYLTSRLQGFGTTLFAEMTALAVAHDAVNLGQGAPDFPAPAVVKQAAIDAIAADNSVLKATVTYSPSMASSAISLARLIGQGKGMSDLVELQVPKEITLASETITKDNAGKYAKLGF